MSTPARLSSAAAISTKHGIHMSGCKHGLSQTSFTANASTLLFTNGRCSSGARCAAASCTHATAQRAYHTSHARNSPWLYESNDNRSSHSSTSSAASPAVEAEKLFSHAFGPNPVTTTHPQASPTADVEALFVEQFGAHDAVKVSLHQHNLPHNAHHHTPFPAPAHAVTAASASAKRQCSGSRKKSQDATSAHRPWSGLWELLAHGHYAGVPSYADVASGRYAAMHSSASPSHQTRRAHHAAPPHAPPAPQGSASASASMTPDYSSSPSSTRNAAYAPHPSTHNNTIDINKTGANKSRSAVPPGSAGVSSQASPPPSPALVRYWHSYRLWQSIHQHVQQESGVLEGLRTQIRGLKAAQRSQFQAQLRSTTRWTLFVVMPLLTALWVSIFFDSMVYRAEVLVLPFVNYEAALAEFEEMNAKEQRSRALKGTREGKPRKKSEIRID